MSEPVTYPPVSGDMSADASASVEQGQAQVEVKTQAVATQPAVAPRRVRLALTRVNVLSVTKVSFLLSVATGIMLVVAAALVWFMLDKMHVFSTIQDLVGTMFDSDSNAFVALVEYMRFSRAISMATIIAVVNIVLTTALSAIGALLYNVTAALVGGVHLTLADE